MTVDLIIRGGIVVDGTGLARRRADLAIHEGRIQSVGHLAPNLRSEREIDAEGMIVAPGIVDAHTHYDPQLTFEPYGTCSCYHGVTTILAGNCGFSIAPTRPEARPYIQSLFAKVEGMAPAALDGVRWDFETFPEYLAARRGKLGVNLACYIGHSSIRRYVMGEAGSEREADADEIHAMRAIVREAMAAGAAGFSSSHVPTQVDGDDRPIPSRFSTHGELIDLAREAGLAGGGSISYLPKSVIGGLDSNDEDLLIELALASRLPIVIQGVGGRDKVDAPTAGWEEAKRFLDRAAQQGAAIFSLLRNHPFDRPIDLDAGTPLYAGVPSWHALMSLDPKEKRARLRDPAVRDELRDAVDNPNRDPDAGSTLPPPHWDVTFVDEVTDPANECYLRRTISEIAAEQGKAPADTMLDLALSEDLKMKFRWENKTAVWEAAVHESMKHPSMLMGVSDGGAHLDRDDGSDWSTYFLSFWVLDRGAWTLEEGIRQLTQVPAAMAGLTDRGALLPGYAADIMIFDPKSISPGTKRMEYDLPGGEGRFCARPRGFIATIVNGQPIVLRGELQSCLPGEVLRPTGTEPNHD
ncbi:MAG: amidohydrolase family protein [Myxococcota bacterium]|nr:amidohydrolase family protein [Myxococcota bacterium]